MLKDDKQHQKLILGYDGTRKQFTAQIIPLPGNVVRLTTKEDLGRYLADNGFDSEQTLRDYGLKG